MKNLYLLLPLICIFIGLNTTLNAQNVNIPDANFKAALVGNSLINTNSDTEIQISEAQAFSGPIIVGNSNITDLTGIEEFTALTYLDCRFNQLTSLDISANILLDTLYCFQNQIDTLNVNTNTALKYLHCGNNLLTMLDVSLNTSLVFLSCEGNLHSSIDVSNNTSLTELRCGSTQLTSLDVSANTSLTKLVCSNSQLTSLNLSANSALTILGCNYNQLTSLDLSSNTSLTYLSCFDNQLTSLDLNPHTGLTYLACLNNQLSSLSLKNGNNTNIAFFNSASNPNLSCIEVDDISYSATNWTSIDTASSFSLNCNTSIFNIAKEIENLKVYPNPTTKIVSIDFGKIYNSVNIEISNTLGQKISTYTARNTQKTTVSLGKTKGIYFVRILTSEGEEKTLKILKE